MQKIEKRKDGSVSVTEINDEPHVAAEQQYKDECDVNNIMKKYRDHGVVTHLARSQGVYADLSDVRDLKSAYEDVFKAERAFAALPAEIRNRMDNDPANLIAYINDPKNYDEGVKLGIYEPKTNATASTVNPNATASPDTQNNQKPEA